MELKQALTQLKALGNDTVFARNKKQGVGDNQFGAQMGDIRKLAKKIKADHELGLALFDTGNYDAMLLGILLITPKDLSAAEMNKMVKSAVYPWVADWLNSYVVKSHPDKEALRVKWMKAKDSWSARAGWNLTAERVARSADGLDIKGLLDRIEKEGSKAPKETQWTMNSCLVQIGVHFPAQRKRAIAIAEKLGMFRDYPVSKGCTSPFAPIWIDYMVKRQA